MLLFVLKNIKLKHLEDFFGHFQGIHSSYEVFRNDDVEILFSRSILGEENQHMLSCSISVAKVVLAISKLKCNKSAGFDILNTKILIACKSIVSPLLYERFNCMFENCFNPESRACGVVIPNYKKLEILIIIVELLWQA